jgi:hypothetical protein
LSKIQCISPTHNVHVIFFTFIPWSLRMAPKCCKNYDPTESSYRSACVRLSVCPCRLHYWQHLLYWGCHIVKFIMNNVSWRPPLNALSLQCRGCVRFSPLKQAFSTHGPLMPFAWPAYIFAVLCLCMVKPLLPRD